MMQRLLAGYSSTGSTSFSKAYSNATLFVFFNSPLCPARAQGKGPRGY